MPAGALAGRAASNHGVPRSPEGAKLVDGTRFAPSTADGGEGAPRPHPRRLRLPRVDLRRSGVGPARRGCYLEGRSGKVEGTVDGIASLEARDLGCPGRPDEDDPGMAPTPGAG